MMNKRGFVECPHCHDLCDIYDLIPSVSEGYPNIYGRNEETECSNCQKKFWLTTKEKDDYVE